MKEKNPTANFDYNSIPVGYYDEIFRRGQGAQSKWHHLKFSRVRREIPPQALHLDIACGPGTFMGTLPETVQSIGLDLAEPQIAYARERYAAPNRRFDLMEPGKLPLPDASVEVATSMELIEHIREEEARVLLREAYRVLKPGGRMILTTPNYAALWPLLEWVVNRFCEVSYAGQHITKYTAGRLRALLADAGFEVERADSFLFFSPFAAFVNWSLADRMMWMELPLIRHGLGHLLLGIGRKP